MSLLAEVSPLDTVSSDSSVTESAAVSEKAKAPLVSLSALTKSFGDLTVLKGIDLEVRQGEVVSII
ncbi:hypothetical protein ACYTTR_17670, partial [Cobetia marina]